MADYIFLRDKNDTVTKVDRNEFAKNPNAYRDYSVRMRNSNGVDYAIPFEKIDWAIKQGLHVYRLRDDRKNTQVAPQKPKTPQNTAAPQAGVEKPKTDSQKSKGYVPTWQEMMAMQGTANGVLNNAAQLNTNVKKGLDTQRVNQENLLANSAMSENMENNQDNLYLDELEKKGIELQKQGQAEVEKQQEDKGFLGNAFDAIAGARTGVSQYQQNLQSNEKMRQGTLIQKNVEDARKAIKDAEISQNKSWYEKLGRGIANGFDIRNFDGGVTNLQNALTLYNSATSKNPTETQSAILDSEALKNKIIKANEDKISNLITSGETTTMMFPFMVQIGSNPVGGIGKFSSDWALGMVGKSVASNLGKRAALMALKGSTRLLGTAIEGAGANIAFNSANILSDAYKRNMGNAVGSYGSDGYFHYNEMQDGEVSFGKAFAKAFGASTIEYQSELVGEYFSPILKGVGKFAKKGLEKAGVLAIKKGNDVTGKTIKNVVLNFGGKKISLDKTLGYMTALSNKQYAKAFNDFRKATHWDGTIGEYGEEVVGNIENAMFVGDKNFGTGENGVFNLEDNLETLMAVSVGSAFMGALGGVGYMGSRIAVNRGYKKYDTLGKRTFGIGAWNAFKEQFNSSNNPAKTAAVVMQNLDEESARVIQNYVGYSMAKQGELIADVKNRMEEPQPVSSRVVPYDGKYVVQSFAQNGNILESKSYDNKEDADMYQARVNTYIDNTRKVSDYNNFLLRDVDGSQFERMGIDFDGQITLKRIAYTEPFKRSDAEQEHFDNFINSIQDYIYPSTEVHEEKESLTGAELAGESEIVDESVSAEMNAREGAALEAWKSVVSKYPDVDELINRMSDEGRPANEIAQRLIEDGYSSEIVSAYCELYNSKVSKDAYINKVGENIESAVARHVSEATFSGRINGQEDKNNIYNLTDGVNTFTLVGGEVNDTNGELTSDGLVVLRDANGNFVQRSSLEGLALQQRVPVEQYRQSLLLPLQENATEAIMATEVKSEDTVTQTETNMPETETTEPETEQQETAVQEVKAPENPTNEDGDLIYDQMPLEATVNDLYNGDLDEEQIREFVGNNVAEAKREYEKVQKKAPKIGTSKKKFLEEKAKYQSVVDEAKRKLDYWNNVEGYIQKQTKTTDEDIAKAKDELSGKNAEGEYNSGVSVESAVETAGKFIRSAKIKPDSFRKETGYGLEEQRAFGGMISNNGKTIDQLAEDLVSEDNSSNNGSMFHGDTMEAKNAIIEALQGGRKNLGKNTSDDFKEFERERNQQRDDFYEENFGMSYSDYLAFEEQEMPSIWRQMSNFVAAEYDRIVNESYELRDEQNNVEQINNENNGNNTEGNRQLAGGSEVLPTEGSNQQGGTSTSTNPAAETTNGSEGGNQNEEVQGSTQGVGQIGEESSQWNTLSEEDAKMLIQNMEDSSEDYVETELSPESWNNSFDEDNSIETPIGRVKMGGNQISKFLQKKRTKEFGMVAPTLSNPDVIVEEKSEAKDGNSERQSSYIFIKTFNRNGEKIKFYASITVKKDGMEVSISSHYMNRNAVEKRLMEDNVIYIKDSLLPNSSDMHLAENPNGLPDLLPTQESNESISEDKDTTKSPNPQEKQEKTANKLGYSITPVPYTTKRGKTLDTLLVKFDELSKEKKRMASDLAKSFKGWWSTDNGGFMMRDKESAQQLADAVMEESEETLKDNERLSLADMKAATGVKETEGHNAAPVARIDTPTADMFIGRMYHSKKDPSLITLVTEQIKNGIDKDFLSMLVLKNGEIVERQKYSVGNFANIINKGGLYPVTDKLDTNTANWIAEYKAEKEKLRDIKLELADENNNGNEVNSHETTAEKTDKKKEERDPRYLEGWDGDYDKWKKRQDYYDEVERKEQKAVSEGRNDYYIAGVDGWGQRNGVFHKLWLLPNEVKKDQWGGLEYADENLWTREQAYHTEEGFQLGNIYYNGNEFLKSRNPSKMLDNPDVDNHDWSQYKKGDLFEYNGHKCKYQLYDDGRSGVPGVVVEWLDDNGNNAGKESVPPLMFIEQYKRVKEPAAKRQATKSVSQKEDNSDSKKTDADNGYGANNALVSRDRYEELKKRMRMKLRGQMNMGIDPEILAIGTEMAAFHIEAGARKFADYAKKMIEDLGDAIRPYLKSFYNGARELPEVEAAGYSIEMTPYEDVRVFDVANFDKTTPDTMSTTEEVAKEQDVAKQAEEAKEKLTEERNEVRRAIEDSEEPVGRPATEADFENNNPIVYYKGKRTRVAFIIHKGGQTGATTFEKPQIESVYLPTGENVKLSDLTIIDKEEGMSEKEAVQEILKIAKKGKKERGNTKKSVSLQAEPDLFSSVENSVEPLNEKENGVQGLDGVRAEGLPADSDNQEQQTGGMGKETGQESGRPDGRGKESGSGRLGSDVLHGVRLDEQLDNEPISDETQTAVPKNTANNHVERGVDYAPKSVSARISANIEAIELMQQLVESGEKATKEQMEILRKFSGWGGLGAAFKEDGDNYKGKPIRTYLIDLLGEEGFKEANDSRNSGYYTAANYIDAMWDIARSLGFKGGNVLEGSAGIGNIIGLMPKDLSERSNIHAVEIDSTTGNILSLLYPDANVEIKGFENTKIENGSVDLAITNVPFVTGWKVKDTTGDKDLSRKFSNIHDFCIAKNVRKLREGGIGIFITSSGTMDNSTSLREWIVNEGDCDFVGAFRLNKETFGGTGVTSDIVVLRKRVNGRVSANAINALNVSGERVVEYDTGDIKKVKGDVIPVVKQLSMDYNKYFIEHPEYMGGEMKFGFEAGDTYRPTSRALYPVDNKPQVELLRNWVKSFNGKEWDKATRRTESNVNDYERVEQKTKEGSLVVDKNGNICSVRGGVAIPLMSAQSEKGKAQRTEKERIELFQKKKIKGHTKAECFNSYTKIKDALNNVLAYETNNDTDGGLQPLLGALNKAYDDFVNTYGHFHGNTQLSFLKNDVDFSNVFALEKFKETMDANGNKIQSFGKTDVFSKRVVRKDKTPEPENINDGIIASIYLYGRIDVPYISSQLKKSEKEVKDDILKSGLGFENPLTRRIDVSYEYLSGNVREKLQQAKENNTDGKYDDNIKALEKVIPANIPSHLIDFTIGSSWIEPKMFEDYVKEKTDIDVTVTSAGGTWVMNTPYHLNTQKNRVLGVKSDMLRVHIMGTQLIEAAMQNKTITVSKQEKHWDGTTETITDKDATQACSNRIDEIRQEFKDWAREKINSDPEMAQRIERVYNEMFNNYVTKRIPKEFIPEYFSGQVRELGGKKFEMRPHQAQAVIRATTQPLMLAHEVGTGKTFTLITIAMEMRRLGTARKPMIVVQNATLGQFVEKAKELYPNAKILSLSENDRTKEGRMDFYAKIKYNDWDIIVVPQSVFEKIPDSDERQMRFVQDKIDEKMAVLETMSASDPNGKSLLVKQANKELENLKEELAALTENISDKRKKRDEKREAVARQNAEVKALEMLDRQTDEVENFDDMGIDAILIDEAHEYKHLGFTTAMRRGVKGIDPTYSKKSQGVYLKAQAVLEKNNGRNVVFATGTPISNTAAEIWTFMKYLMPEDTMKQYGIYYFDDFVRNFGNISQMLEFTASGSFKEVNRFAGYVNLPELVRIWSSVTDTVLTREAEGVEDKIPDIEGGKAQDIYLPQTRALRSVMKYVKDELKRYEEMSGSEKKRNSHIPLVMFGIAKAAAVDARLVVDDAVDEENSKTNESVRQILKSLKETEDYKGTVALFADNYRNKNSGFNLFQDIREKLINAGVPAEQIAIIATGMTVKKKLEIFDKVNNGDIRVIMGSTFTLGTGVNIQERLHTLIHIDAPTRPMDYTQRNGRILRQGNFHKDMNKPVRVLRFGVEDSLDVTAYQRLKTKGAIADSIMNGKAMMENSMENRTLEEEEDVFGDTVAQLSGSEYAMLKNQAEKDVKKYRSKKKQWESDQRYCHGEIPRLESYIDEAKGLLEKSKEYLDKVNGLPQEKTITIGKNIFRSTEEMADYFKDYNKKIRQVEEELRENPSNEYQVRKLTVNVGGIDFEFENRVSVDVENMSGKLFTAISRGMTYSCKELGLEKISVKQSLLRVGIEDIINNVVSGDIFKEDIERFSNNIARDTETLRQIRERYGKPFEFEKELALSEQRLEEYTDKMIEELAKKEAKYAEIDAEVETATNVTDASEEDDEDTVKYRLAEDEAEEGPVQFRLREEPAPKKTGIGYKVFVLKNGKLYPPMVANPNGADTPVGVWLDADAAPIAGQSKTGRPQVKAGGKGTQGGSGQLAYRPGWHLGVIPYALQFNRKNPDTGERELFPNNFVWAEVEYANDIDYQEEARQEGINASGKYQHSLAGLKKLPVNGSYMYRTNPDPRTDPWVITGAMKVNRILKPSEVDEIVSNAGREPQKREKGAVTDKEIEILNKYLSKEAEIRERSGKPYSSSEVENNTKRAEKLVKKLNAEGFVDITTSDMLEGKRSKAKGFYDPKTGKVTIVIDNHKNWIDVEKTLLHEIVGHKGLRGLLGKIGYRKLMDNVWSNLTDSQKKALREKAVKHNWQYYTAIDEYLAEEAEKMVWDKDSHNLWDNVKHYITEALRKLGFMIMPNYKDVRYWLWLSYNNLKSDDVMSEIKRQALIYKLRKSEAPIIERNTEDMDYTDPDILEREGDYVNTGAWQAIEERLTSTGHYWKEAFVDYMNAYKIFQDEMEKGINGPLMDNMNAYNGENQLSSKVAELQERHLKIDVQKMQDQVDSIASEFGKGKEGIRGVEQYLYMKSGLERNRVLFMRDWFRKNIDKKIKDVGELPEAAKEIHEKMVIQIETRFEDGDISAEQREKMLEKAPQAAWVKYVNDVMDEFGLFHRMYANRVNLGTISLREMYDKLDNLINEYAEFNADTMDKSGISAMSEYYVDGKFSDNAIIEKVMAIEEMLGNRVEPLWDAVSKVTQKGLEYDYMSGIIGEEAYNRAKSMFSWYIPMRGFDKKTMEDQYNYMQNSSGIGKKSLVSAKGRTTLARSPLSVAVDMGLSAIRRGEDNMNKQRAYRLVNRWQKDNPDALAPATVVDVWYEVTGTDTNSNPTFEMAIPKITDDMDADEIREAVVEFNEEMRAKEMQGLAMKDKIPASFVRPFESKNHKSEHIVFVYMNGRQKMIVFNGNPRPAQALNGELRPTSGDGIFRKLMRIMAGAFTSYNPTFVVTNLSRDTLFANHNIAIKESYGYWNRFTRNQVKLIGGLAPNVFRRDNQYNRLWSDYNKGIEPTTELGVYFNEFMMNGGKTGFVNQIKIDKLERMIYDGNKKSNAKKIIDWLFGLIQAMNERVENVNRFSAYVTSRQMGRSIMRSINDAKEVSVNFNRKGAGKSTANGENPDKAANLAGSIGGAFRSNYLFFNAGVQSFYTLARNTKNHPFKTIGFAMSVPFVLGSFVVPMVNKIIGSLAGDDGDEEYANIPEWTRRNNICIYLGGGKWSKIPLPIELRAFYGIGDIAAGYTFDERLKSTNPLPIDMISQLSQILPVDFMGEGGNVLSAFVPDVIKPVVQIMTNTDWTGKPIQKATTPFNQYDPEYTKAFKYEFEPFVKISKGINNLTGGTDVTKGWYDGWWNSPAYWNHIIGGYGGGFIQDIMKLSKLVERASTLDGEDFSAKEVPIFKALFETPTERTQYYRVMNKFQIYRGEAAQTKHDLNKWKKSDDPLLRARYVHDTYEATKPNKVRRMELVDKYLKKEKRLNKLIERKETPEIVKKAKKEELTRMKIDLVNELDMLD